MRANRGSRARIPRDEVESMERKAKLGERRRGSEQLKEIPGRTSTPREVGCGPAHSSAAGVRPASRKALGAPKRRRENEERAKREAEKGLRGMRFCGSRKRKRRFGKRRKPNRRKRGETAFGTQAMRPNISSPRTARKFPWRNFLRNLKTVDFVCPHYVEVSLRKRGPAAWLRKDSAFFNHQKEPHVALPAVDPRTDDCSTKQDTPKEKRMSSSNKT